MVSDGRTWQTSISAFFRATYHTAAVAEIVTS
jgi:hypothetical protein